MYRPRRAQAHRERDASEMWPVATWQLCRNFVFSQLANRPARARGRPLIIGVQGPQGSGKHSLVQRLASELSADGYGLRVDVLSIDDLCLPLHALETVQRRDPGNTMLHARGVPGSHDVALGERVLCNLRGEPEPAPWASDPDTRLECVQSSEMALLPRFEGGAEVMHTVKKPQQLDVFLIEGWCLGLAPLGAKLEQRYAEAQAQVQASGGNDVPYFLQHPLSHLQTIDGYLSEYAQRWVSRLDAFIQLWPVVGARTALQQGDLLRAKLPAWDLVFEWQHGTSRTAPDEDRMETNFLTSCMPIYELWAATGQVAKLAPWSPVGPGSGGAADPWLKSDHALEWRSRPTDIPPEEERGVMPHALPERLLRIDLDKRRSVQHFALS